MLTVLFIGLKLTGYIDWNWFFVLAPTLVPLTGWAVTIGTYVYLKLRRD